MHDPGYPILTTVIAPAGFGKSTLLAEMQRILDVDGSHAVWLTFDEEDNDPAHLLFHLALALRASGLLSSPLAEGLSPREQLGVLLHELARVAEKVALLIDDFDKLHDEAALELMRCMIKWAPAELRVVAAARRRPVLHLAELRVNGQLAEIGIEDLRFTAQETHALLGQDIDEEQAAALVRSVEGWPVVLKLTQNWLREGRQVTHHFMRGGSQTAHMAQYLSEEISTGLSAELADFMAQISIHEQICAELAYTLSGRPDSGQLLQQLADEHLLLLPVEGQAHWYRHHKLTLHFFRDRLARSDAEEALELHRRAAEWFAAHGRTQDAITHAELARDHAYALKLTEQGGGWRLTLREGGSALRVLRELEDAPIESYPKVQLGKVFVALQVGTVVEARKAFEAMRRSTQNFCLETAPGIDGTFLFESRLIDELLTYYEDRPMDLCQAEALNETIAATPGVEPLIVAIRETALCCGYLDAGDYERCRELSRHVLNNIHGQQLRHVEYYMQLMPGLSYLHQGRLSEAEAHFRDARQLAQHCEDDNNVHLAFAETLLAELACERGDLQTARRLIEKSLPLLEIAGGFLDVLASGYSTRIALAVSDGDPVAVEEVIRHGQEVAKRLRLPRLNDLLILHRVRELIRLGDIDAAASCWATVDERLLRSPESLPSRDIRMAGIARLTGARLRVAMDRLDDAMSFMESLEPQLAHHGFERLMLGLRVIKACCLYRRRDIAAAAAQLKIVTGFAMQERYCRIFTEDELLIANFFGDDVWADTPVANEIACLRRLMHGTGDPSGEPQIGPEVREKLLLSPREAEVMAYLADGLSNKEIARQLGIAEGTVKIYRKNIYRKLDVRCRSGVIEKGRALALLP